jgi:hypothetical protein
VSNASDKRRAGQSALIEWWKGRFLLHGFAVSVLISGFSSSLPGGIANRWLIKEGVEAAVGDSQRIAQLTTAVFTAAFEPVKKRIEAAQNVPHP